MKVIADLNLVPVSMASATSSGSSQSISSLLLEVDKLIATSGLDYAIHAHGINLAGELDTINELMLACIQKLHDQGINHVAFYLRIHSRASKQNQTLAEFMQTLNDKFVQATRDVMTDIPSTTGGGSGGSMMA